MDPLPVVPLEFCSAEGLVYHLQRAAQRHRGLLLFQPGPEKAAALLVLKQRPRRGFEDYEVVAPHEAPAASAALHKLGRKFTKVAMQRIGEHPYTLHAHLDDLADWLHPTAGGGHTTHSSIMISRSRVLGEHVDRGLFNLVLGTAADLEPIHVTIGGERVGIKALLPADPPPGLLGLLIPGYTLQCVDPTTPAVPHGVNEQNYSRLLNRSTLVLQWRLHPDFAIGETSVGELLQEFEESVRATEAQTQAEQQAAAEESARRAAEERAALLAASQPKLAPAKKFTVIIRTLTGKSIQLRAHPLWTVGNILWSITQSEGIPMDQQRLVYGGRQIQQQVDDTVQACGISHEDVIHLVLKHGGD